MRVMHIVGVLNGWAIVNRAKALERALAPDVESTTVCYREVLVSDMKDYDFIHVHGLQIVPLIRQQLADCPVPWGFEVISERSLKSARPSAELLAHASTCFCKNPGLVGSIRPFLSIDPEYIPNGVDTKLFRPRPVRVGWVGNKRDAKHLAYKGVPLIEQAVELLNKQFVGVIEFEFTPDPSHYPDLVLPQSELVPYYQWIDVLVCASEAEGCSNVVNEALACGILVVSTNVGIAKELAAQRTGLLIVSRTAEQIARGIAGICEPAIDRRKVMIEEYDWPTAAVRGKYIDAYRKAIGASPARKRGVFGRARHRT